MALSREAIDSLPTQPGVYLLRSARGKLLYVGKAKNLRARVRSYLAPGGDGRPLAARLVERAAQVETVVTPSVKDALLLENELIKRHRPPFNVRLRDDKQYLGLRLDPREPWPRLVGVRRFRSDGALYFGPYTSSAAMREAIADLRRIFPLRSCSDAVLRDYARRGRPCIEFEMGRCAAPCCDRVSKAEYDAMVHGTVMVLRGHAEQLERELRSAMEAAARHERFEEAARLRDRLRALEKTTERQRIVSDRALDRDVFGLARSGGEAQLQVLHVRAGRMVGTEAYPLSGVELGDDEALASLLAQYYADGDRPVPPEVLVPRLPAEPDALEDGLSERAGRRVRLQAPRRGLGRHLVEMATTNARLQLERRLEARESLEAALDELREQLGLARRPERIECYDVSTLGAAFPVASRVVFEHGRPVPAEYRRYRIREARGGDDLACLREVLGRRLARRASEPLPDLLVVDGGRGQVEVARALLRDAGVAIDLLGLAKERDTSSGRPRVRRSSGLKAERVVLPGRKNPVLLPRTSSALLLLQRIRDEAHRFAIEYQRRLRRRAGLVSVLEEIPGIGPRKRRALLRELGSLRAVRAASLERLRAVPGLSMRDAEAIRAFFDGIAQGGRPVPDEAKAREPSDPSDLAGGRVPDRTP